MGLFNPILRWVKGFIRSLIDQFDLFSIFSKVSLFVKVSTTIKMFRFIKPNFIKKSWSIEGHGDDLIITEAKISIRIKVFITNIIKKSITANAKHSFKQNVNAR